MKSSKRALIVIDIQQDYFAGGNFPLWNSDAILANILTAIAKAKALGMQVILVRHLAESSAPFLGAGSPGAEVHPALLAAAPGAIMVTKAHADSFVDTDLETQLQALGVAHLLVCGMMTQNCVTHTAISKSADKYAVAILADCCTTVSQTLHAIALSAVSTRMTLATASEAL